MRTIRAWPGSVDLGLPDPLRRSLMNALISPFATETDARAFWDDYGGCLAILEPSDDQQALSALPQPDASHIEMALRFPDFTESIGTTHLASVSIVSDEGAGFYLLIPLTHPLLTERRNE